ncbi:MAG TPA: hypothetical protein DCE23_04670 [Firmicutes bacterium]|nr:hypothetical protein [Bacillota bacterium]
MNGLEEKDALNTISNVSGRYNKIDKISYRAKIINENRNKKEIKNISDEIKFYDFESSKPYYIFNVRSVIDDAEAYYGYQKEV